MSARPLPGTFFQIGYVVPNLDAALAHLNSKLGAPRVRSTTAGADVPG